MDKILDKMRPTSCTFDLWSSWLIKAVRNGLLDWLGNILDVSLRQGNILMVFKEKILNPFGKKRLNPSELGNYRPVSKIPFWGKLIECVKQLSGILDKSCFRLGYGTETSCLP